MGSDPLVQKLLMCSTLGIDIRKLWTNIKSSEERGRKMDEFPAFEEIRGLLDEIAEEVPEAFYRELHGGIILIPEEKKHQESKSFSNLYIMGEYHRSVMGRKILIYYGSFKKMYPNASQKILRKKLKDTLFHEFTHHIESLAGERGLERKDEEKMHKYRLRKDKREGPPR